MLDGKKMASMSTETRNQNSMNLDRMSSLEIVSVMNHEDTQIAVAVEAVLPQIATVVDWAKDAFMDGGRLIYMGAGTSGRLGVLDASECPPTFGTPPGMVVGLIAGGDAAIRTAVEGAEDSREMGIADLKSLPLTEKDVVVGIAASGRTPYCLGGMGYAKSLGCKTVAVVCNLGSEMAAAADLAVEVIPGPEVLTGSTRLKAGTSQKMVLNMISTAAMVGIGKAYQNLMVDVKPSNEKLNRRAENIVMEATGVAREEARLKIDEAGGSVKIAITMILAKCSRAEAEARLEKSKGHVRAAVS